MLFWVNHWERLLLRLDIPDKLTGIWVRGEGPFGPGGSGMRVTLNLKAALQPHRNGNEPFLKGSC